MNQEIQQKINRLNQLLNKALVTNPPNLSLVNLAQGELQSIYISLKQEAEGKGSKSPSAKTKE